MFLQISIEAPRALEQITTLKRSIDFENIEGITETKIEQRGHLPGTQGMDVVNSIKIIIEAAEKPLVELVRCLQKYVDGYRSKVKITKSDGSSIEIEVGRAIDKEMLKAILANPNNQL